MSTYGTITGRDRPHPGPGPGPVPPPPGPTPPEPPPPGPEPPPPPPTPGGGPICRKACRDAYDENINQGMDRQEARALRRECIALCGGDVDDEVLACVNGKCIMVSESTNPTLEQVTACQGKADGAECESTPTPGEGCEGGHKLDDRFKSGKGEGLRDLTEKERAPYIPEGWFRSSDWQGHIIWHPDYGFRDLKKTHDYYKSDSSDWTGVINSACEKGMERRKINGEDWCCPAGGGGGGGGGGGNGGGEFTWSEGTQAALQKLLDRYNYLMENPRGTSDAERQAIINFATERLKRGERGEMQSMKDRMSRMGLSGSGFQESEARGIERGTREGVVGLQREVATDELDRRFTELMGGTQMAQGLMGTMMTGEQLPEILSAARRGEGTTAMQQFLAYLQMIMGSYGQGSDWLRNILG